MSAFRIGLFSSTYYSVQTKYMTANDINIGIGALLETFEMMFVFIHCHYITQILCRIGSLGSFIFVPSHIGCTSPSTTLNPNLRARHGHPAFALSVMLWTFARLSEKSGLALSTSGTRFAGASQLLTWESGDLHITRVRLADPGRRTQRQEEIFLTSRSMRNPEI